MHCRSRGNLEEMYYIPIYDIDYDKLMFIYVYIMCTLVCATNCWMRVYGRGPDDLCTRPVEQVTERGVGCSCTNDDLITIMLRINFV